MTSLIQITETIHTARLLRDQETNWLLTFEEVYSQVANTASVWQVMVWYEQSKQEKQNGNGNHFDEDQ